ncbi:hypothetical protein G6F43_008987 [Rhizopus delemar]|nr:hypothetical protein G6F43_008987 [Rhizopus delemar]
MKDYVEENEQCFCPPLWRQRRLFILDILRQFQVQSILDYGCGEASVLSFLIPSSESDGIKKMAGIDICSQVLEEAIEACLPWPSDYKQKRIHPLEIDIYKGSVGVPDDRLKAYEAIVCSEVIEHLYEEDLKPFFEVTLGFYRPRILIVTTPNCEYNVNFPDLQYGTEKAIFRHDDHKFEWTRQQFQNWCLEGATKYDYEMKLHGIGLLSNKQDNLENGHCTQACIFIRRGNDSINTKSAGERHELLKHIEFPYYDEPPKSEGEILHEIHSFIEVLCKADYYAHTERNHRQPKKSEDTFDLDATVDWNTFDIKEKEYLFMTKDVHEDNKQQQSFTITPLEIPILHIWDISRIRQLCKTIERLKELLAINQDTVIYTIDKDRLIVNKAYEVTED